MRDTPTSIEIDLGAVRHNFQVLKKLIPPATKTVTVVKSNAYGHGAVPTARILQSQGADIFGVGTIDEGIQLREAGIKRPILILLGLVEGRGAELLRYQLTPVLYDLNTARDLQSYLKGRGEKLDLHVKIDTGMTRLGVTVEETPRFFEELSKMDCLNPIGLITHLSDADKTDFAGKQIVAFEKARVEFQKRYPAALCHVANSLATVDKRYGDYGAVRLGVVLYGAYPIPRQKKIVSLQPVMKWKSRIISIKKVPKGTFVSYGRTFLTKKPSRIGCVPVGYADGYPRLLSNKASVLVRGQRVPVAGTVCMDMFMIDLTTLPSAQVGDEVVLLGPQGKGLITAEEVGAWANTISYEIFCKVAERLPRHYIDPDRR